MTDAKKVTDAQLQAATAAVERERRSIGRDAGTTRTD